MHIYKKFMTATFCCECPPNKKIFYFNSHELDLALRQNYFGYINSNKVSMYPFDSVHVGH